MTTFATIVADPPWPIKWSGGKTRVNGRGQRYDNARHTLPYRTMSIDEIAELDVGALAAPAAHLYLWTVDRFLFDGSAARVARAWGFTPRRLLVWRKTGFGLGTFPRPQHESVLIATRGRLPFVGPRNVGSVQTWRLVYEKAGKSAGRRHSAKPAEFFALAERVSPAPRLELFARAPRAGWQTWGDECPVDVVVRNVPTLWSRLVPLSSAQGDRPS